MQNTVIAAALMDEQTTQFILSLRQWLIQQGFTLTPDALPPHLLLCSYAAAEQDVIRLAAEAAAKTRAFSFTYSHVGVVPGSSTFMLAPEVNRPLLSLRERFVHSQNQLLHTPLLTVPPQMLPQVLPYVLHNVQPFDARVTALAVFRQDGTMLTQLPV